MLLMKKLPSIYKNSIDVHNNLETFYSKNDSIIKEVSTSNVSKKLENQSVQETLKQIFSNKQYSYTKRVRVTVLGKTFETRFISEKQGNVLTIDNEFIKVSEIDKIDILS